MKKKLIIFILISFAFICFGRVGATPYSTNLLNPSTSTRTVLGDTYDAPGHYKVTGGDLIPIDSDTEYFLMTTYFNKRIVEDFKWQDLPYFDERYENSIEIYGNSKEILEAIPLTKKLYAHGIHVGYAISVEEGVGYFRIKELNLTSNAMKKFNIENFFSEFASRVDYGLILIKAQDIKFLPEPTKYIYQYQEGSYDVSNIKFSEDLSTYAYGNVYADVMVPVFEIERLVYETSVDNPVSIPDLMKNIGLFAYDEIDGDLTSSITYQCDEYLNKVYNVSSAKERILGEYIIDFFVSDSSGNCATCSVTLIVSDHVKPVVDYQKSVIYYEFEVYNIFIDEEFILGNIFVSDNHSELTHQILHNSYKGNEDKLGTYEVLIRYFDYSNNYTDVIVTIKIVDLTAPDIKVKKNYYNVSYRVKKNLEDVLKELELEIIDNYDEGLSYEIISNGYKGNENKVGSYIFIIRCTDNSGNYADFEFRINVIDNVAPIIYVNRTKIDITTADFLSISKIKDILIEKERVASNNFDIEIVSDNYTPNYNRKGEYEMGLRIIYEDGEVEYQLLKINVSKAESKTIFGQIIETIKKIFQFIWNIIKWPFEKLFRIFF